MKGFFKELKRRRVWQVMVIYIAVAWGLVQAADTLLPIFEAPPWILKTFTVLLVLGFPVALLLAWAYDLTPGGIRRDDAPEDAAKSGNVQVETSGRSVPDKPTGHFESKASTQDHKSWVAVMPFKVTADDAEMSDLGAGLTEDISAGLARFAYLAVVAQESVTGSATKIGDVREFSRTLGARYVIAGSVRGSTGNIRVSVRLIEAAAGVDLWVENYTRNRVDSDLFATGDEIVARIVATIADSFGVLVGSMTRSIENKPETELTPNDWVLRTFDYLRLYSVQGHAQLRDGLEGAVMSHPRNAEVRACLAQLYLNEYNFGFNPRPDSLNRALREADLAIELDSTSLLANQQLAQVHFFSRNLSGFRHAAERTLALNPLDTNSLGILGLLYVHARDFERGIELTERAMDLNGNYAHWCHFSWIWYHCAQGDYENALDRVSRVALSQNFWIPLATAAICVQLGRNQQARDAVAKILELDPDFSSHARANIEAWHFERGNIGMLIDGLRQAGLAVD